MRKFGYWMLAVGLLGAFGCFYALSGAALPFPNPTPELLQRQNDIVIRWTLGILVCLLVASLGAIAVFGAWRHAKQADPSAK